VGASRPFIEGLLPEGEARTVLEGTYGVPRGDVFGLLQAIGGECAGALQIVEGEPVPDAVADLALTETELEALVRQLPEHPLGDGGGVRLSLAGMQDKLLLARRADGAWVRPTAGVASTHILKPQPTAFSDLVQAEEFGLAFARALRADVARSDVLVVAGRPVLAVERYDRILRSDGTVRRLHQEDFCRACARPPEQKNQEDGGPGWSEIADVLRSRSAAPRVDLRRLALALVVNALLGNADAHARNLSLLHGERGSRLAPLYDLIPTLHLAERPGRPTLGTVMAMTVNGVRDAAAVTPTDAVAEIVSRRAPRSVASRVVEESLAAGTAFCAARSDAFATAVAERIAAWS